MGKYVLLNENDFRLILNCLKGCSKKEDLGTKQILLNILENIIEYQNKDFIEKLIKGILKSIGIPDVIEKSFIKNLSEKKIKNKYIICEYYLKIIMESNDSDISSLQNNYYVENLKHLSLKDDKLFFKLLELYKTQII